LVDLKDNFTVGATENGYRRSAGRSRSKGSMTPTGLTRRTADFPRQTRRTRRIFQLELDVVIPWLCRKKHRST
jgi:hypothetical protein